MFTQLYLSFLLRIIFVKIYFYKLAFALKNYNKCCAPGQTGKQSVHNNVFSFASTFLKVNFILLKQYKEKRKENGQQIGAHADQELKGRG